MNRRLATLSGGVVLALMVSLVQIGTGRRAPVPEPVVAGRPVATTSPTAPTTQAADSTGLPEEFAVLRTHSPFGHGHHSEPGDEDSFVFKGVMQSDDRFTAFLEDVSSKKVLQLAAGDAVAHGKIKNVDLDSIEYEATGKSLRVEVGQNLMGQVVPSTPTSKPAGPNPNGGAPPGGPPGPSPEQMNGQPMPPRPPRVRPPT